jgi:hypothetical protein
VLCLLLLGTVACGGSGEARRDLVAEPHLSLLEPAAARIENGVLRGLVQVEAPPGRGVERCHLVIEWEGRTTQGVTEPLPPSEVVSYTEAEWRFAVDVPLDEEIVAVTGRVTCGELERPLRESYASNDAAHESVLARYCSLCPDRSPPPSVAVSSTDYEIEVHARVGVALRVHDDAVIDACDGAVLIALGEGMHASAFGAAVEDESRLVHLADRGEALCGLSGPGVSVRASRPERMAEVVEQLRNDARIESIRTGAPPPP